MELIDVANRKHNADTKLEKNIPILTDQVMAATLLINANSELPAHVHGSYDEIDYIVKGGGEITIGDDTRQINEGMMVLVPRGTSHNFLAGNEGLIVLSFSSLSENNGSHHKHIEYNG